MDNVWPDVSIESRDGTDGGDLAQRIPATAAQGKRVERETLIPDTVAMGGDAAGHMHLPSGVPRRARHAQAVGPEVPVLRDQEEEDRAAPGSGRIRRQHPRQSLVESKGWGPAQLFSDRCVVHRQ